MCAFFFFAFSVLNEEIVIIVFGMLTSISRRPTTGTVGSIGCLSEIHVRFLSSL